jgi:hypothetical protein
LNRLWRCYQRPQEIACVLPPALELLPVSATDVQRTPAVEGAWQPARNIPLTYFPRFIFALS